ncbi:MAG TPA: two-component regulator propeller domain-containing protein, partial [Cytophagaceae bacterium]|nr:two-component regulator propeller domain-containing protein [Cytophagaceae bacterium]
MFCLFSLTSVFAQQPVFKNYAVKDGLPSSEVYDVIQDSKGFMWFCTDAGISRYDGYTFHNFSTLNGLCDNTVFGSYEDRKGRIWFRTMSGKLSYFFQDSIYSIEANERISTEMRNGFITSIYIDPGDTIWCGVAIGKGYYKIAPPYKGKNFEYILIDEQCSYLLNIDAKGYIWGNIVLDKNNLVLLSKPSFLICEYSKRRLMKTINNAPKLISNSVFLKTSSGDIIITGNKGVYSLSNREEYTCQGNGFISLYKDKDNTIWSGKSNGGVFLFPKGDLKQPKPRNYLKGESVTGIKEDFEGGFWFTTLENGVYYMASPNLLYYNKANGLTDNKVLTLIEKDSNRILIGTTNGVIGSIEKDTIRSSKANNSTPFENPIYKLYNYPGTNKIIAGAYMSFLFTPGKKYRAEYFLYKTDSIAIKCFAMDAQNFLWGGNYLHLLKIDPIKKNVIKKYISKSRILSLYCDADNRIWLGCVNGLWSFKGGIFQYYGEKNSLLKNR